MPDLQTGDMRHIW